MVSTWDPITPGVIQLPSGRLVRGRALRQTDISGAAPEFGVYLLGRPPAHMRWDARWVRWPNFRLPADQRDTHDALTEAWRRSVTQRVEIACYGGWGRTGTALACLAVLDGVPGPEAVAYVRDRYDQRAVETPWQRRFVSRFRAN